MFNIEVKGLKHMICMILKPKILLALFSCPGSVFHYFLWTQKGYVKKLW